MMNLAWVKILLILLFSEPDPKEIVQKSLDLINGKSNVGESEMTVVRPKYSRTISMKSWSLGSDYFLIYIIAPARDKGQVFMKRNVDLWNWLPSISRMIKLPPSMMGQSWMGSDFTNDDLVKMNSMVEDYDHKLLGEEFINDIECYRIELIPKPNSAIVWGKVEIWISKSEYYQMRAEYFDEDMELVNYMEASEIKQFNDRKLPSRMEMIPVNKKGHKTIMVTKQQDFNQNLEESFFSQQEMKRIK